MNKKEREAFEALERELALAWAWKLTDPVERDLPPPELGERLRALSIGWNFNAYSGTVYKACSSSIYHGEGWEKTSSQGPLALFSSFDRAKAALRYAVEREALERLAVIDRMTDREVIE